MYSNAELHSYEPHDLKSAGRAERADAITTQVIRHALGTAANQMKRILIRTAFSTVIYESLDFAVALYDAQMRLLAQAPTMPAFVGTMSFCVEGAVAGVGGEASLEAGDIILYNLPYGSGSHAADMAMVMPVFLREQLVGYAVCKAHLVDIGAKAPYCSDTTDMFQEGIVLDGVKLFRGGELVGDVLKIMQSNSRMPSAIKGDLLAEVACCRAGGDELLRIIERFGMEVFLDCTERMYEHGEAVVRDFISTIPEGRYQATGHLDDDGLSDNPIAFDVTLIVENGGITFDLSAAPDAIRGPLNTPFPGAVSVCRVVLAMMTGNDSPNEGHFKPLKIISRPGSMLHPVAPQPTFLYGPVLTQLFEALFQAFAQAMPGRVPSGSAGDLCPVMFFGWDEKRGDMISIGNIMATGWGAHAEGDGALMYHGLLGQAQMASVELTETKSPLILYELWEIQPDSAGVGRNRGGVGWKTAYRLLRDASFMTSIERAKVPSWGQAGGQSGAPNRAVITYPDGRVVPTRKVTGTPLPKGTLVEMFSGGGGGYGPASERDPATVLQDLRAGYLSEEMARKHYPQAFTA